MGWIAGMVAWVAATTAHADPCAALGVGKDPGSSVAITTMVRHLAASPPTPLTLELRGDGARLLGTAPPGTDITRSEPATLAFEDGTHASWMGGGVTVQDRQARRWVFPLDSAQLEQLKSAALVSLVLPMPGGEVFDLVPDKDNQKTVQAGARCILSRDVYPRMMLWIGRMSGGSSRTPTSSRIGWSTLPNASKCAGVSNTSTTWSRWGSP